jgi:hypothetical protein
MCFDDQGLHRYYTCIHEAVTADDRQISSTEQYRFALISASLLKFKQSQDRSSIRDDGK